MSIRKSLNTLDRSFLASERRDVMMHVGSLLQFSPPKGGATDLGAMTLAEFVSRCVAESKTPF